MSRAGLNFVATKTKYKNTAFAEAQVDEVNGWSQQNSEQYVCLNFVAVDLRPLQT